jgi:uncharacterized membrane-anchored protein
MRKWINLVEDSDPSDAAKPAVRELLARAAQNGVNIEIEFGVDSILLIEIVRSNSSPKGTASDYMTELCSIADKHDLAIMLHVAQGMRKLVAYYERFGFIVDDDEENEDNHHADSDEHSYGYEVPMYRDPR